jgi:thymidylate kinase
VLIAAEGIDGAGKTTLLDRLAAELEARGRRVVRVRRYILREITDIWWRLVDADVIDQRGTALLAAADYELGVRNVIRPALAEGAVVLADKYVYSHYVYFHRRGLALDELKAMFGAVLVPDVVLYLTLPIDTSLARLRGMGGKPDLLEAGLDHRLGLSIGQAFRRYGLSAAPADLRESHYLDEHARDEQIFARVLPPDVTHPIDGMLSRDQTLATALDHVAGRMERVVG